MSYLGAFPSITNDLLIQSQRPRDADRFSGDAVTTSFDLSFRVDNLTDMEVFVENVQQEPITSYTVNGKTLTFGEAPPTGTNNIYVIYRGFGLDATITLPNGSISFDKLANNIRLFTTDNFTANGTGTTFVLSETPADANTVMVSIDGIVQRAPTNYSVANNVITFSSVPSTSSNVSVRHLGFRTTTTVTAIPANTRISQPNLVNPSVEGTITGGNVSATSVSTELLTTSANLDIRVGESQNTAFRIDTTGQLYNTVESTVGTDFRNTLLAGYMARAWVNFNGQGTVAIRASGNVSSIADNGTGDYTVNFATAMPDTNYAIAPYGVHSTSNSNNYAYGLLSTGTTSVTNITASSFRFKTGWLGSHVGQVEDLPYVGISFFR